MSIELTQAAPGAPASYWNPYPAYKDSGVEQQKAQGSKARINKPQINADERRLIASVHREGRKAQQHKSLSIYKIIRPGTRMTRIGRIFTDIRAYQRHPRNPCSTVFEQVTEISNQWHFSLIIEKGGAQ